MRKKIIFVDIFIRYLLILIHSFEKKNKSWQKNLITKIGER